AMMTICATCIARAAIAAGTPCAPNVPSATSNPACNYSNSAPRTRKKHHLPSALRSARAESCDRCKHYRKFFFLREQALADPIADDLASLALDILIGEKDYSRGGYNPFLIRQN
ncbi:formate dehydrogenase accessory protein FdhE, partial [Brevundimonas vesicularis]|uniref:formate dehydrogenase accessory protein FdhE n=1 Tax=Brevundimonas vesicularis TaxID=41276 RepID=UPI00215C8506